MNIRQVQTSVQNWVSNPKTAEFVENTFFAVSVETGLKMIGRPAFIMADKEADSLEKKKYAATKEMLYQGTCIGLYVTFMPKIKQGLYNVFSKGLSKASPDNAARIDEFNKHHHLIEEKHKLMKDALGSIADKAKKAEFKNKALEEIIKLKEEIVKNKRLHLGKGVKEFGAILGSIGMLTVVAPQIGHLVIHPLMKVLGFDKAKGGGH